MLFEHVFDIDIAEIRRQFVERLKERPPEGLSSPELLELLVFEGPDSSRPMQGVVVMTLRDGGKTYLVGENLELLTDGYDEIRSYESQGFHCGLFEVRDGERLGIVDLTGRQIAEVKYRFIYPQSVTCTRDYFRDIKFGDLFSCELAEKDDLNGWEVIGGDGAVIYGDLCSGLDVCQQTRRYKHFVSSQEVGEERYEEEVRSFYIYKAYKLEEDFVAEYAFEVSLLDLVLGYAEAKPDEKVDIRSSEYPRQKQRLSLRRDFGVLVTYES